MTAGMMTALVVLAQKIFAVVVAVRRAHDDMDRVAVMVFELRKRLAGLVIEFNDDDRIMNAVIKHAVLFDSAAPGEMGVMNVPHDLVHFDSGMTRPHAPDVKLHQGHEPVVLLRRQFIVTIPS